MAEWLDEPGRRDALVGQLLESYVAAARAGNAQDRESFVAAHPEVATELRAALVGFDFIHRADGKLASSHEEADGDGLQARVLGDFRILREVGRGGMGVVYEAEQISLGRHVALKVLPFAAVLDERQLQRFKHEAKAAALLHHTNIVPVYSVGSERGVHYYAMEYVEGLSLAEVVRELRAFARGDSTSSSAAVEALAKERTTETPAYCRAVARLGVQAAEALDHAHQEGVIHRDIKPANLMIDGRSHLWITDFGLARSRCDTNLTVTGDILGTVRYMSPEQALAKRVAVDHRTDIYSLGITLYEVLTLEPAFSGDDPHAVIEQIAFRDPAPPQRLNRAVPAELETILLKAVSKDPEARYATAQEMADDLRRYLEDKQVLARRPNVAQRASRWIRRHRRLVATGTAILLVVGTALALAERERARRTAEESRRLDLEYAQICIEAEEAMAREQENIGRRKSGDDLALLDSGEASISPHASELLAAAIRLDPARPEAYFARSFATGRTLDERLADIDVAAAHGLPERPARLARAYFLDLAGRIEEGAAEERRAGGGTDDAPSLVLEGLLGMRQGDRRRAIERTSQALQSEDLRTMVRFQALWWRSRLLEQEGDLEGALADLHAAESLVGERTSVSVRVASLWRRLGREAKAESLFSDLADHAAHAGSEQAWIDLSLECQACREFGWMERMAGKGLDRFPASAALHNGRGVGRHEQGRSEEALTAHRRAIEIDPDRGPAHYNLGRALDALGRHEHALAAYDRAIELNPLDARAHTNRGAVLIMLSRPEMALEAFDRAIEIDPTCAVAHVNRVAVLSNHLVRPVEALEAVDRAIKLAPMCISAHVNRGIVLRKMGRYREALEAHDRAIGMDPNEARAHLERGRTLVHLGRHEDALVACDRAVELRADDPLGHCGRGAALGSLQRLEEALAAFGHARDLDPRLAWAHEGRAGVLFALRRNEEALHAYDRALEADPDSVEALTGRANVLVDLGRHEEALAAFDRAVETHPSAPWVHASRGAFLSNELGRHEQAIGSFDRAIALEAGTARFHYNRGTALHRLGRREEALADLDRALALDATCPNAHANRGAVLFELGRHEEALAAFDRAVEIEPQHAIANASRGGILLWLGRKEEALAACDRAIAVNPADAFVHATRARALFGLGRVAEALESSEGAVAHGARNPRALNEIAWVRATSEDSALRDPRKAIAYATEAARLAPQDGAILNTLGVAQYRVGDWKASIETLRKSMEIRDGGDAYDWLFLAMAQWQLGEREEAGRWYARAVAWLKEHEPADAEALRFRAEAEEILGIRK